MKKLILISILIPTIGFSQKIKEWEYFSFKKENNEWIRGGFVSDFFNKQSFRFNKKGLLIEKKNYRKSNKLIGSVKYVYKNGILTKRTYKNLKSKKTWETFYARNKNGKRVREVWFWNKINREDSIVFNYFKNGYNKIKYNEKDKLIKYWTFNTENGKIINEKEFSKDSILKKEVIWKRTKNGIPISKIVIDKKNGDILLYQYNEKGIVIKINRNDKPYKRFEITEDKYGNWNKILTYNQNNTLIKKVERKIKYY